MSDNLESGELGGRTHIFVMQIKRDQICLDFVMNSQLQHNFSSVISRISCNLMFAPNQFPQIDCIIHVICTLKQYLWSVCWTDLQVRLNWNVKLSLWAFTILRTFSVGRDSITLSGHNRSHQATFSRPQFTLCDIIPLCSLSIQKANLLTSFFEKVFFSRPIQESIKRFGSEINWRGTFTRNERGTVSLSQP